MKLLKIEAGRGLFLLGDGHYQEIEKINKNDLVSLAHKSLTEEVIFDAYDEKLLPNQAHQILYKDIFEKLRDLNLRRDAFKDESDRVFHEEYRKYKIESERTA